MAHPDTETYYTRFPGLPWKAIQFFDHTNAKHSDGTHRARAVWEFIETFPKEEKTGIPQPGAVDEICQRLCGIGYLSFMGVGRPINLDGAGNTYLCMLRSGADPVLTSRYLDCVVYGFPCIYDIFKHSILPISHVAMGSERTSIGTGFVVGSGGLLTAAHCLDHASRLGVRGVTPSQLERARFFVSSNEALDLGFIWFAEPVFAALPPIGPGKPNILQEVMAMGYPDIAGFLPDIAAEKAAISSRLTAVRGSVSGNPFEIFARTELLLITARVRGGFSGGPVLNNRGNYVGLVSRDSAHQLGDSLDSAIHQYDNLGYGTAIPSDAIGHFVDDLDTLGGGHARRLDLSRTEFLHFSE